MASRGMVILGGGECGARAAFALRENGYDGPVTLIGAETHLPYERPPLSKAALLEPSGHRPVAPLEAYRDAGIELRLGVTVDAIQPDSKMLRLNDGGSVDYDKLLLATGARPRRLPGVSSFRGRIKYLRTFDDAVDIRSRLGPGRGLAIIGAGFIGLELAATARALGADVTLVEAQPRVLQRGVPEEIANVLASRHRDEGVDLRCGVGIRAFEENESEVRIELGDGTALAAETAVVGIGAAPDTALAEAAGVAVENGIAVDATLRTNVPDIFAAGDCCSFPLALYGGRRVRLEAWRNAQEQGSLAARNMLGGQEVVGAVPYFWSDQYDLTLQVAGLAEGAESIVRRQIGDEAFLLFHLGPNGALLAASGIGRGNAVARDVKLAERLIAAQAKLDPDALASPDIRLKTMLAA